MKQGYAIRTIARTLTLCFLFIPQIALGRTFYVDGTNGNDTYSSTGAQNPATPWKTIKKAMGAAMPGDTVSVKGPYTYNESIESKRDGTATAPITLMADTPGTVTVDPPPFKNGFFITHDHHVIDGFIVTGATVGVKIGPHDAGNGPVTGVIVRNCQVTGNSSNGIQLTNAIGGVVEDSTVSQNGRNGIFYSSGQDGQIHDNVVNANAQFGIYVRSGTGYQVWNNTATGNGRGNIKIVGSTSPPPGTGQTGQRIFYVSATTGDDARDEIQAQNSSTPWKTIGRALQTAIAGETVIVLPGSYNEHVQSRRDGISNAPITIKAAEPGTVTITPPSGFPGIYIGHHYHVVEGLIVIGSTKDGIQMGPYGTAGNPPVNGPVARNNIVCNNNLTGIKFSNAVNGTAAHNVVCRNAKDGIWYSGNGANIFNNLVYGNGTSRTGDYGITLYSGSGHQVTNNTVYSNLNGGVRLALNDTGPVFSTALNNIVVGNPVGFKEPAGSSYTGRATLDYNDVYSNSVNYDLSHGSGTVAGSRSISADPVLVSPANSDFRLGSQATGQAFDSPAIDRGSSTANALGLSGRTAFTDKFPDEGPVDLGYHGTVLKQAEGSVTVSQASLILSGNNEGFTISANLQPGTGSDGIEAGTEYVEVEFGGVKSLLRAGGFSGGPPHWTYSGGDVSGTIDKQPNGSVDVTVQANGLALEPKISTSTRIAVRVGDDYGATLIPFRGTLRFP